jgi:hypothetical protein
MITRARLASAAMLLLLASASVSFAQAPDSSAARSGARPGRGAIGGLVGGSWILAGKDYSDGAQPRFSLAGNFRYVISRRLRWQVTPLFTWSAYRTGSRAPFRDPNFPLERTKDAYLTQLVGATGQLQLMGGKSNWNWHLGAGPGVYRVVIQNHRKVLKDPVTKDLHQGAYLCGTAECGVERFMKSLPNTSLEWTVAYHAVLARRDDQFTSGFNAMPQVAEFRFGGNYYFDFKSGKKPGASPAPKR